MADHLKFPRSMPNIHINTGFLLGLCIKLNIRTQDINKLMRNSIKVEKARIGANTFDISYLNSSNILPINNKSVDSKKDFSIILSDDFSRKNFEVTAKEKKKKQYSMD